MPVGADEDVTIPPASSFCDLVPFRRLPFGRLIDNIYYVTGIIYTT